jgi:hypothetical protein
MFQLDDNLLRELGLGDLPAAEKNKMLAHIYETLELRVGMRLADQMSDAQLDEFEGFIDRNDEAGALKWLETNFPHYKDVVAEELEKLKNEIRAQAPEIMRATMEQMTGEGQERQQEPAMEQPQAPNPYSAPPAPEPPQPPPSSEPPQAT